MNIIFVWLLFFKTLVVCKINLFIDTWQYGIIWNRSFEELGKLRATNVVQTTNDTVNSELNCEHVRVERLKNWASEITWGFVSNFTTLVVHSIIEGKKNHVAQILFNAL